MKLVIKQIDTDGRLAFLPGFLDPGWRIETVDSDDADAFAATMRDADAIVSIAWRAPVPPCPSLRLLQLPGAGSDGIDFALVPATAYVCNCHEHEIGIAEFVFAVMLEHVIGCRSMDASLRRGDWTGSYLCGPVHGELYGKTLGIVGYGRIGQEVARRAEAFGMRVLACSRTPRQDTAVTVEAMNRLNDMLGECDFVLVAAPLTDATRGLIGERQFAAMKRSAFIINVARGLVIDERALFDALDTHRIAGAAIDVWYRYPQQGSRFSPVSSLPFDKLDNLIMTPHASAWTDGLLPRRNRAIADNLNRLIRGQTPHDIIRAPDEAREHRP